MKDVQDVIALAKAKPTELNYGSTGIGSGSHLSTELFMARTGIKMTHVPYRGAAPLVQDMLGGRIDIANSTLRSVIAQIQAGELKGVAIGSPRRNPKLPDVPTLQEQGVMGADASSWTAFFAPAACRQPCATGCRRRSSPRFASRRWWPRSTRSASPSRIASRTRSAPTGAGDRGLDRDRPDRRHQAASSGTNPLRRHREERSDAAIQKDGAEKAWIATLRSR